MIELKPLDIRLIKFYYELKPNEKPDLWGFMLKEYPQLDLKTNGKNGDKKIYYEQTLCYKNLQCKVKNLQKIVGKIDRFAFNRRKIDGLFKPTVEMRIDGAWHIFETSDEHVIAIA